MGIDITKVKNYRGEGFHIVPQGGRVYLYNTNDTISYNDIDYITHMSKNLLDIDTTNGNILVGGLGIGVIPLWLTQVCPYVKIDVIDSNSELISAVSSMGYLPNKIKIINSDLFEYIPNKKYDAIIIDIWWCEDENTLSEISTLRNHYNSYLDDDGKFYTPFFSPYSYEKL